MPHEGTLSYCLHDLRGVSQNAYRCQSNRRRLNYCTRTVVELVATKNLAKYLSNEIPVNQTAPLLLKDYSFNLCRTKMLKNPNMSPYSCCHQVSAVYDTGTTWFWVCSRSDGIYGLGFHATIILPLSQPRRPPLPSLLAGRGIYALAPPPRRSGCFWDPCWGPFD